jgi:molecular chaperone DnaK
MARDNRTLGRFHLVGLPPAPRGVPQVDVTFDIDANGIVHVAAKDTATGKEQTLTITASSGLSVDEVDRLVREAASHQAEDQARRELVDVRNQADTLAYSVERTVAEHRDRLAAADVERIESALAAVRVAAQGEDLTRIRHATDELQQASHGMAELLYQRQSGAQQSAPPDAGGADSSHADVIDGEFAEVK